MNQLLHTTAHGVPDAVLRGMFAARKSVFVDLLGWDVPVLEDRFEIDQFDDGHATYLILTDLSGAHLGSARLLATTRPHILGDLFASLCDGTPPRGDAIFEITRFCLDRTLCASDRRAVRDTLVAAIVDHALDHGIQKYTAIATIGWLRQILGFGWKCEQLGDPRACDGGMIAALAIQIDAATPALLAAAGIRPLPTELCARESVAA